MTTRSGSWSLNEALENPEGESTSEADRCVLYLKKSLQTGHLLPQQRLGEESIAQKLKMGRAAVRIAFERMVSTGLFVRLHRAGTFVRRLDIGEYRDMTEIRAILEGQAARLAARRATDDELRDLVAHAEDIENRLARLRGKTQRNWGQIQNLEIGFHTRVAHLSRNETLARILASQNLIRCCFVSQRRSGPTPVRTLTHVEVAAAVASRRPVLAEKAMRDHILVSLRNQLRSLLHSDE